MFIFHRRKKNFLDCFEQWRSRMKESTLLIFSDFDGTLASIAERPELAVLPPETRALLESLARNGAISLTIVTGRMLEDIRRKVQIKKVAYIANHGFEIEGHSVRFRNPLFPKTARIYGEIEKQLRVILRDVPGVIFEDKGMVFGVHYRLVPIKKKELVRKAVRKLARPYVQLREISLRQGKQVMELRPAIAWDKGKAVLWLLRSGRKIIPAKAMVIYMGDDDTDEDAFKALHGKAITIRIGRDSSSAAEYYLRNVEQAHELLARIEELKRGQ